LKFLVVATFAWPDHYGGAERVIGEVAARLVDRGHDVTLLTSHLGETALSERRQGVEVRRYAVDRSSPARFYRSVFTGVRAALRDAACAGADVLHVHQPLSGVAALAPGARRPAATLLSFYAPYHQEYLARFRAGHPHGAVPASARAVSTLLRHADRFLLRRAKRIVVLSEFSRSQVAELAPTAMARTRVAPAGVDLDRFRPVANAAERAACASRFALPDDGLPRLLSVRRLVPRMGLEDLIEAARRLRADGHDLRVLMAGEGPERVALERLSRQAGLSDRVHLLGRVDESSLPDLYRAATVFVLPSRSLEGFGMATAEALASGLPVVATRAGASAELLVHVEGSALCAPGDAGSLAEQLSGLLADDERRQRAGRSARRYAERSLRWEEHLEAVEEAASEAVASS
jgi:glycosyltransferase involved in cell wall biosynthesis